MKTYETSKSLDGQSELVLKMPIKKGLVSAISTKTYKHRVADITELFSVLRIASRESRLVHPFSDVVDRIQTIHAVHISVVNDDLILSVAFDQPWEPYIRDVWRVIGKLLDVILLNCEGYLREDRATAGGHSSDLGFEPFAEWIRKHQINTDTFYLNHDQTVRDVIYLEELERKAHTLRDLDRSHTFEPAGPEKSAARQRARFDTFGQYIEYLKLGVKAINAFHGMTYTYAKDHREHDYLLRAVRDVLRVDGIGGVTSVDAEFPHSDDWTTPGVAGITLKAEEYDGPNQTLSDDQKVSIETLKKIFRSEITWFEKSRLNYTDPAIEHAAQDVDEDQIQGGIVSGYNADTGCLVLAQIQAPNKAREFLRTYANTITGHKDDHTSESKIYRNIAFSFTGLERLGVDEKDLNELPIEFRQGMLNRAGLIGDVRSNHPDHWKMLERNWPIGSSYTPEADISSVDVVIQLRTHTGSYITDLNEAHPLFNEIAKIDQDADGSLLIISVQTMGSMPDKKGHFGFIDGISQPSFALKHDEVKEQPGPESPYEPKRGLPAGDLFLGHKNSRNDPHGGTSYSKILRDGTFLVIRKMAQDVAALDEMIEHNQEIGTRDEILSSLMGRHRNGHPLPPIATGNNEFDYADDPHGVTVPLHSHVRRTNPRENPKKGHLPDPRILRRGMSYGTTHLHPGDVKKPRGIIFQAYNASIAEQFEVIQRWISGGNRTSRYSRLNDPLFGVPHIRDKDRSYPIHIDGEQRHLSRIDKPFASLDWGMYLFVPSLKGIEEITTPSNTETIEAQMLERGQALIDELKELEKSNQPEEARLRWKTILEDSVYQEKGDNLAVWKAIRENYDGVLPETSFGTLVASKGSIYEVLGDLETYDVTRYKDRLIDCTGVNYLAEPPAVHAKESLHANSYMAAIPYDEAFKAAFQTARGILKPLASLGGSATIPLPKYIDLVLAKVCQLRFGIPEPSGGLFQFGGEPLAGGSTVHCPYHVYSTSRYVFQPVPTEYVRETAEHEGTQMKEAVNEYLANTDELAPWTQGLKSLLTQHKQEELLPKVLLGALLGFLPSANGNFLQTMGEWIRTDEFWRVRNTYLSFMNQDNAVEARKTVETAFGRTMGMLPVPGIIHRTAAKDTQLAGKKIKAGESVVLGLISATAAEPENSDVEPIFGGAYTGKTHACPGRQLAMGTQIGITCALLHLHGALLRTPSEYALDFRPDSTPRQDEDEDEKELFFN